MHAKIDYRNPPTQPYICPSPRLTEHRGHTGTVMFDKSDSACPNSIDSFTYPPHMANADDGTPDMYYTIRPELMGRTLSGAPIQPAGVMFANTENSSHHHGVISSTKLPRVTFSHDPTRIDFSPAQSERISTQPSDIQTCSVKTQLSRASPTNCTLEQQPTKSIAPTSSVSFNAHGAQVKRGSTKEDLFDCPRELGSPKKTTLCQCPNTPKPISDSSFVWIEKNDS